MNIRLAVVSCIVAIAATVAAAGAHVTVSPRTVRAGSTATLTFRCPNERTGATTTSLVIELPPDTPFHVLHAGAPAGWHAVIATAGGATTVRWSGGAIPPGAAQTFRLSAGPMPDTTQQLVFKAVQTYSNGEVVRWIDLRAPGEAEPPLPAPVLTIR